MAMLRQSLRSLHWRGHKQSLPQSSIEVLNIHPRCGAPQPSVEERNKKLKMRYNKMLSCIMHGLLIIRFCAFALPAAGGHAAPQLRLFSPQYQGEARVLGMRQACFTGRNCSTAQSSELDMRSCGTHGVCPVGGCGLQHVAWHGPDACEHLFVQSLRSCVLL